jgi:ribonucleoside-diphosphate reductase subunit M1
MYYLRTKPAAAANQVTVDKTKLNRSSNTAANCDAVNGVDAEGQKEEQDAFNLDAMVCSLQNKDECLMCGS